MVVLKTCNEVMFFLSVMPSEIRQFKFTVSWLCDDNTAADILRSKKFSTSRYDSHLSALSKDYSFSKVGIMLTASRELVDDSRMGTVIGPRSRSSCQMFFSHFLRAAVSCVETAHPSSLHVSIMWYMFRLCGSPVSWVR
jgi:hypothetical protein